MLTFLTQLFVAGLLGTEKSVNLRGSAVTPALTDVSASNPVDYPSYKIADSDALLESNLHKITILVDFGSSGSRVRLVQFGSDFRSYKELYSFKLNKPLTYTADNVELQENYARKLFAGVPDAIAATGISPDAIPAVMGATAGMRQLFPTQQEEIYSTVKNVFVEMTNVTNTQMSTLQGSQEGIYAAAAANFLNQSQTFDIATTDFGGASVQVAYRTSASDAANVYGVNYNNTDYHVYVNSGPTGNDDGRKAAMANAYCFPQEYPGYYNPKVGATCRETTDTFYSNYALHPITESGVAPSLANTLYLLSTYYYANQAATGEKGDFLPFDPEAFQEGTQVICDSIWTIEADPYYATYCYAGNAGMSIYNQGKLASIALDAYVVDKMHYIADNGETNLVSVSWVTGAGLEAWGFLKIANQTHYSESSKSEDSCSDDSFNNLTWIVGSALFVAGCAIGVGVNKYGDSIKTTLFGCKKSDGSDLGAGLLHNERTSDVELRNS